MKRSLRRLSFFALAVAAGAVGFGLFWSAEVHARSSGGTAGPYCPGVTSSGPSVTMCIDGVTTPNVSPATQSSKLSSGSGYCGACQVTPK